MTDGATIAWQHRPGVRASSNISLKETQNTIFGARAIRHLPRNGSEKWEIKTLTDSQ